MFLNVALTKPFRIGRQEDAHEFLRYYVDSMQKSCLKGYPSKCVFVCLCLCVSISLYVSVSLCVSVCSCMHVCMITCYVCMRLLNLLIEIYIECMCADVSFPPSRLDAHSKSTTLVHQLFGGHFRSQGEQLIYPSLDMLQNIHHAHKA